MLDAAARVRGLPLLELLRAWLRSVGDRVVLWWTATKFAWLLALFVCFPFRMRMSHNNGIAGEGWLRIVDDLKFPPHPFFAPGQIHPIRIRHASIGFLDDAMHDFRSISLKFAHARYRSPLDLQLNTGERSVFWNAVSFLQFAKYKQEKWGVDYVEYNRKYPDGLIGSQKGLRRDPRSFHDQRYYSKTPFLYVGSDGRKRYAKYRVLPYDDEHEKETGRWEHPSDWDTSNQRVLPHETRGRNYLKYEYEERVKNRQARYRLQIQTRPAYDDDDPEIFNNMVLWDERRFPWHDLAVFEIERTLDWKESTLTTFSLRNMPKSLGLIPAKSIYDYNSLNYMRAKTEIARKARLLSYRVFGMVPPIPDNDNRNAEDWGV
jgi:hypothetical protein